MYYRYLLWGLLIVSLLVTGILCYLQSGKEVVATIWLREEFPMIYQGLLSLSETSPLIYRSGWVRYHLADIMWSMSFAMLICGIWVNQFSLVKLLLVGMACAIFYEVLQLVGVARGTFDTLDLVYSLCGGILGTLMTYKLLKKAEY